MKQLIDPIENILGYISKAVLWGWLPLDILAHAVVSYILFLLAYKLKFSYVKTLIFIFVLALIKEFHDSFVLQSTMQEHYKDLIVTMIIPVILFGINFLKKRSN
jgi:Na+-translocating ferredoxin:NAD+ oxidoreductase RnfA subunit